MTLLDFYIPEWFFVALSLCVLVFLLWKILWKPVGRILDERENRVRQSLEDVEAINAEKLRLEEHRAEVMADLDRQAAEMAQDARVRAGKEYDRIVSEAEARANAILLAARERVEREREAAEIAVKDEIKTSALALAGALLEANLTDERNERLIEAILARRGASL